MYFYIDYLIKTTDHGPYTVTSWGCLLVWAPFAKLPNSAELVGSPHFEFLWPR